MFDRPHRLHPAAIVINFGTYFVSLVKTMAIPIIVSFTSGRGSGDHFIPLFAGLMIAGIGALSLIGPVLHFFSTTYYIEGDALVINSGFIWRKRRTIPLARIQNVNVERTIWHRLLGAASVKVETAAGSKSEGDLTALSVEDAGKLQAVLLQKRGVAEVLAAQEKPEAIYSLSTKQILLAGVLGNRVMYIVAGIFSVFQVDRSEKMFRPVIHYLGSLSPLAAILASFVAFAALVVVGWIVSIVMSATRFYGFRIDKHERGLLLTHGLITQFRTIVPIGRIQSVRVVEPILFRLYNYCEIYADTAGTFDKKDVGAANKICPILPDDQVDWIGRRLIPEFEFANLSWSSVSPKTVSRHAVRYFFTFAIIFSWPLARWLGWNALWFTIPIAVYCWLLGVLYYRFVGYSYTNDLLVSRSGVYRKQSVMIPFDRIQRYTIRSSFFQRMVGLATVVVSSASAGGHAVHIVDMDAEVANHLSQTIGEAIGNHLGSRRGGL